MVSRRRFLQILGGGALAAGSLFGYSRLLEPTWLAIESIDLTIPGLPAHLDGLRFAQISDIHLGPYMTPDRLASTVRRLNEIAPEFVMVTGDFVCRHAADAQGLIEPFRGLEPPAYATLGNHDLWTDSDVVSRYLQESGITLLRNGAVDVAGNLVLAGLDSIWGGRPDLRSTLQEVSAGDTVLLMVHEPDYFDEVIGQDAPVAVQFSGHSHGGQVRLPTFGQQGIHMTAPILPRYGQRYPIGHRQVGQRQVYTNRGLGVWPAPVRLNCRPELSVFTLKRGMNPTAS